MQILGAFAFVLLSLPAFGQAQSPFTYPDSSALTFYQGDTVIVEWQASSQYIYLYLNGPQSITGGWQILANSPLPSWTWTIANVTGLYYFALHAANSDGSVGADVGHSPNFHIASAASSGPTTWSAGSPTATSSSSPAPSSVSMTPVTSSQGTSTSVQSASTTSSGSSQTSNSSASPSATIPSSTSTSASSPTSTASDVGGDSNGLSGGAIAGIVIGAVSAAATIIGVIIAWSYRNKRKDPDHASGPIALTERGSSRHRTLNFKHEFSVSD